MEKIGLLYRVSSKPQETDGSSLDVQREIGIKISEKLGLKPQEFNEGVQSSFKVEINQRPKLVELLDEIQKPNGIRKVWVFNTDRLGRYSQSWYSILKVFIDYGVQIYIGDSTKPYDLNNSPDKLMIGVLSLISQYDNELRRMRSIMGKRNSLRSGNTYLGSTIPFGYTVKNKKLKENEKESFHVKKIFTMYNQGKSTMDIKMYLDKIPDIKPRRTKLGWNLGTIQKMMRNTIYIGTQVWKWEEKLPNGDITTVDEIIIKTPKLIEKELWESVNQKMNLHLQKRKKSIPTDQILGGTIVCNECGLSLSYRKRGNSQQYYGRCSEYSWKHNKDYLDNKKKNYNKTNCKMKRSLNIVETDEKILDKIIDIITKSSIVREKYKIKYLSPKWDSETKNSKRLGSIRSQLRNKRRELESLEDEQIQIEYDVRTKKISESIGSKLREKFKTSIEIVQEEIDLIKNEERLISESKGWVNWISKMEKDVKKIMNSSLEQKRDFINRNVQNIKVFFDEKSKEHDITINFRLPIVGDELIYDKKGIINETGFKDYKIKDGDRTVNFRFEKPVQIRTKLNKEVRKVLNERIIQLKEVEFLSLKNICETLNKERLLTPTGKNWDKPKLSSYYRTIKGKTPKKV